jgi:1-acyl-sn-glycerol-3-phosphate acyltransferase
VLLRLAWTVFVAFWTWFYLICCTKIYPKGSKALREACHKCTVWTGYLWCCGSSVFSVTYIRKPNVSYKKYLGPDWTPSYDKFSTVVANHCCWLDSMVMMCKYPTSFIAKASVE